MIDFPLNNVTTPTKSARSAPSFNKRKLGLLISRVTDKGYCTVCEDKSRQAGRMLPAHLCSFLKVCFNLILLHG